MKFTKDVPAEPGFYWAIWKAGEFRGGNGKPLMYGYKWEGPEVVEVVRWSGSPGVLFVGETEDTPCIEVVRFGDRVEAPTIEIDERLPAEEEAFGRKSPEV